MASTDGNVCEPEAVSCPTTWDPLAGYQRPKFDLNLLTLFLGLAAIWLLFAPWMSWYSLGVLAVFLLTFLFGCWRTRWATLAIAPAMMAPYAWIFWNQVHGWGEYRRVWLSKFFEMPGTAAPVILRALGGGGAVQDGLAAAIMTACLFLLLVTGARINRQWLLAMTFLGLNLNLLNSLVIWGVYKQQ